MEISCRRCKKSSPPGLLCAACGDRLDLTGISLSRYHIEQWLDGTPLYRGRDLRLNRPVLIEVVPAWPEEPSAGAQPRSRRSAGTGGGAPVQQEKPSALAQPLAGGARALAVGPQGHEPKPPALAQTPSNRETVAGDPHRQVQIGMKALTHPSLFYLFEELGVDRARLRVSEWVEGPRLRTVLNEGGALPFPRVFLIGLPLCRALVQVHAGGKTLRDLSPDRIFLDRRGAAKILPHGPGDDLRYQAPERLHGGPPSAAADVFGLGALLFEMICGRTPFAGESREEILARMRAGAPEPVPPRGRIPEKMVELVRAALDAEPERRPATEEAREYLEHLAGQLAVRTSDAVLQARSSPVVAALPLTYLGKEEGLCSLGEGLASLLAGSLAGMGPFRPISVASSSWPFESSAGVREVGKALNCDFIIQGGFTLDAESLGLSLQLVDATRDAQLGAASWSARREETGALILTACRQMALWGGAGPPAVKSPPIRGEALLDLARAQSHLTRYQRTESPTERQTALSHLESASKQEPRLLEARLQALYLKARAGESIEPPGPEDGALALAILGLLSARQGDPGKAKDSFLKAISLSPHLVVAHRGLAGVYLSAGLIEPAIESLRQWARFNPLDGFARLELAKALAASGRPDEALHEASRVYAFSESRPGFREGVIALLLRAGVWDGARDELAKLAPGEAASFFRACLEAREKGKQGERLPNAPAVFPEPDHTLLLADLESLRGSEKALDLLEQALENGLRCEEILLSDACLEPLRGQRRFRALLENMREAREACASRLRSRPYFPAEPASASGQLDSSGAAMWKLCWS